MDPYGLSSSIGAPLARLALATDPELTMRRLAVSSVNPILVQGARATFERVAQTMWHTHSLTYCPVARLNRQAHLDANEIPNARNNVRPNHAGGTDVPFRSARSQIAD